MEDRAVAALLKFFLLVLLCLVQTGTSKSKCLDNIPQYGSRGTGGDVPHLPSNNIYIIPNYTFSCYGNMTQWGACVEPEGGHDIIFSVYRPSDDPLFPDCYSPVGSNTIVDGTATDGCITLNVSVSDQISVEPGDVVGLLYSGGPMNGIETDATVSNVIVWYNTPENFGSGPPNCPFRLGPGGSFPFSAPAAPVITAVVEPSPVTSTPSPSPSTSSHSPAPSTPSPSTIPSPSSPAQDGGSTLSTSTVAEIAAGAVGVVIIIIIIILLITISILKFKVKDTSTGELKVEMKSNECYTATTTTHSETYNAMELKNNEAYQSATNTVTMEQNKAYSGTVVGATQDVTYEEVDGMYEEV